MAKARITTKEGATITLEGSHQEVAKLISQLNVSPHGPQKRKERTSKKDNDARINQRATPINLISTLIDGGFFKKPKDLAAVKVALEELGHVYPVTSLSPALLRLVRRRQLRRIKDKNRWLYTGSPMN